MPSGVYIRSKEHNEKISKALQGKLKPWLSIQNKTNWMRNIVRKANLGRKRPDVAERNKKSGKNTRLYNIRRWQNIEYKLKVSKKISEALKKKYIEDSKYKTFIDNIGLKGRKVLKEKYPNFNEMVLKWTWKRPTSYETRVIDLIKKYNLPYKYVGNGEIFIGRRNPDFININNQKILIEVYNDFHHSINYEKIRYFHFKKYGFKTIFINEKEITDKNWEQICLLKIKEFKNDI